MATELFDNATANGATQLLAAPIGTTDTTLPMQGPASIALQASGQFHVLILNPVDQSYEYATVTGNAWSANWTVTRGSDNSTPKSFPAGSIVKHVLTAEALNNMISQIGGGANYLDVTKSPYNIKGDGGTSTGTTTAGSPNVTVTAGTTAGMAHGQTVYIKGAGSSGGMLTTAL